MKKFIQHYRNARTMIAQIKAGEWKPNYNPIVGTHLVAHRGDLELWIGTTGPWFCDVFAEPSRQAPYFGLFWRHYVYWAAARGLQRRADATIERARKVPVL